MVDESMSNGSDTSDALQIVVCELGDEHYGLDIARVIEIIRQQPITAVPQSPVFVKGVMNLRGRIIPVVDLRSRFGMPAVGPTKDTRIVVADSSSARVGLVVDAVSEVLIVPAASLEQTPNIAAGVETEYLRGIAKLDDRLILLLEIDGLFQIEDQSPLAGAA